MQRSKFIEFSTNLCAFNTFIHAIIFVWRLSPSAAACMVGGEKKDYEDILAKNGDLPLLTTLTDCWRLPFLVAWPRKTNPFVLCAIKCFSTNTPHIRLYLSKSWCEEFAIYRCILHWRAYKFQFRVRCRRQIGQLSLWCYLLGIGVKYASYQGIGVK